MQEIAKQTFSSFSLLSFEEIRGTVCFIPSVEYFYKTKIELSIGFHVKIYRNGPRIPPSKNCKNQFNLYIRGGLDAQRAEEDCGQHLKESLWRKSEFIPWI